jgi:hypothetical protein
MVGGIPASLFNLLPRPIARALRHKLPCYFCRYVGYKHLQLGDAGHIRLLKLLQGSQGAPLTCSFLPTPISLAPKYAAISYAWGDPLLKHKIKCEDGELSVTENVKVLLGHLRDPGEDKLIWIDAICINQNDFEERGQQVRLMGQIYSSAEEVKIWLGPEEDDSALLEQFIPRLAEVFWRSRRTQLFTDEVLFQKTKTDRSSPEWIALKRLFERPWFNRTWVVQEIVASTQHTFICGDHQIRAESLVLVASQLRHLYLSGNNFVRHHGFDFAVISKFLRMARIWKSRMRGEKINLSYLTYSFWSSQSSDPKDKIFSMLGLDNEMAIRMMPDYRDSVQAVYTKATRESLLSGKSTGILSLAGIGHRRVLDDLPSRVPDFSITETPSPPFGLYMYDGCVPGGWESYNVQIFEETLTPFLFEGNEFALDAIKFNAIKSLNTTLNIEDDENLSSWVNEAEALFRTSSYFLKDGISSWEIHWRSLIADRIFEYASYTSAPPIYGSYYLDLRQHHGMQIGTIESSIVSPTKYISSN